MSDVTTRLVLQDEASSKLSQITSNARSASTQLRQMGQQMDRAFSSNSPAQFAARLGRALDGAERDAQSLGESLGEALDELDQGINTDFARSLNDAASGAEDLADAAAEAGENMEDLAESTDNLGESIDDIGDGGGLDDVTQGAEEAGGAMNDAEGKAISLGSALKTLFAAVAGAKVLGEIKDFAVDSINLGRDFTSMMSEVQAISGASAAEIAQMEATARAYGATTIFSATEAAEALKYMSLAGWDANQSSSALGGVLNLAAASGMGLGQASDMVTDYLSAFGMEAKQSAYFADMLSYAQSNSNTTAAQLGEAYLNSAANLHAAGQDVETVTSLLEAMANQGTKGSRAGTQLAAISRDITNAMEDGKIMIGDTAIQVADAEGNFRDYTEVLADVGAAVDGMGSAQRAAALATTFTADSTKGINQILNEGMDNIAGYEEALRNAGGAAEEAANIMNDNLNGDLANMNSAFEEMKLQVFEGMEEPLRQGVQFVTSEVIPTLTEWVPDAFRTVAQGVGALGEKLGPLISTLLKNPKAVGTALTSIGTGLAVFKTAGLAKNMVATADGAFSLSTMLGKLAPSITAHPWLAGAAALGAAVVAIKGFVDDYNEIQVNNSLTEHFGTIDLSDSEISNIAGKIISVDWVANINLAMGEFENAHEFHDLAQEALDANKAILWQGSVLSYDDTLNIKLTPEMSDDFITNIDTFLQNKQSELESLTFAAKESMETVLGDKAGSAMIARMQEWAADDSVDMSALSSSLTQLVQDALEDGVLDVEEQAAIDLLTQKINNIVAGWQEAQADAEWQTLQMRWSGKDLTSDSFVSLIEETREQRQTAMEALDADTTEMNSVFNAWLNSGKITETQWSELNGLWTNNYKNLEGESMVRSLGFESGTLTDAYGDLINENLERISTMGGADTMNALNYAAEQGMWGTMLGNFASSRNFYSKNGGADRKSLNQMYESMKPDVMDMGSLLDSYRKEGMQIPQALMDAYNQAIDIGAASGDEDAAWQKYANTMLESGNEQLRDALMNESNPMYETIRSQMPEELAAAVDRAVYAAENTTESADLSELFNSILGLEGGDQQIDLGRLQELCDKYGLDISDYLTEHGIDVDGGNAKVNIEDFDISEAAELAGMSATGNAIKLPGGEVALEYEVNTADTLSGIAEKSGIALEELKAANQQIFDERGTWDLIYEGDLIYVPQVEAQTDGVAEQAGAAAAEASSEAQAAADAAATDITTQSNVNADITVSAGTTETGDTVAAATTQTQGDLDSAFASSFPVNGNTDVTLTEENNVAAIYSEVGDAITNAFSAGYSAHAAVNVVLTANYSLANPTATLSFSGGATGTSTVSASLHAAGGYFDTPHLGMVAEAGVGEYIIPMDGSDRSIDMWKDAGQMLGVETTDSGATQRPAVETTPAPGTPAGGGASTDRNINVNVNGSGAIKVSGGGASKEQIVEVMLENLREVFMNIVEQEIVEEGEGVYEY